MRRSPSPSDLLIGTVAVAAAVALLLSFGLGFGLRGSLLSLCGLAVVTTFSFSRRHGFEYENATAPLRRAGGEGS